MPACAGMIGRGNAGDVIRTHGRNTVLYERHQWSKRAYAAGTVDKLPDTWHFSVERVETLLDTA